MRIGSNKPHPLQSYRHDREAELIDKSTSLTSQRYVSILLERYGVSVAVSDLKVARLKGC